MKTTALVLSILTLIPIQAGAYGFNAQNLKLAPGYNNPLSVQSGDVNDHLEVDTAIILDYSYRPLSIYKNDIYESSVIRHRVNYNLVMSMGLLDFFDIGLVAQLVSQQGVHNTLFTSHRPSSFTFGDTYVIPKFRLLNGDLLSLSVSSPVSLPTGKRSSFTGDKGVSVSPTVGLSFRLSNLTFVSNLGYTARQNIRFDNIEIKDEVIYGAGVMFDIATKYLTTPFVEVHGRTSLLNPFELVDDKISPTSPLETDIGVKTFVSDEVYTIAGVGVGLKSGHNAPTFRIFFGLGINESHDEQEEVPMEDFHWPEDNDWDDDGILNDYDWCPLEPEDFDGFQDEDGCPEVSMVAYLDGDQDGVLDGDDKCPNTPFNERDLVKEDGCTMNPENIAFEFDSDKLKAGSHTFLGPVVDFLNKNQDVNLRVEGHTDSTGDPTYNTDLSIRRALTIRQYLVDHGIDGSRVEAVGFGEEKPLSSNTSARGREVNRRVEFVLVKKD